VIAGEELLNRADSRRDSLGSAVSRLLEADPGLTVHAAIVQAILEEEPDGLREWTPAAPHEWQRRY
jgi:phage tail protein X